MVLKRRHKLITTNTAINGTGASHNKLGNENQVLKMRGLTNGVAADISTRVAADPISALVLVLTTELLCVEA